MFVSLDVYGTFIFFAAICAIGLVVLGLWAPETKRVPLEQMDELFEGKWYMGWKAKVAIQDVEAFGSARAPSEDSVIKDEGSVTHEEKSEE